MPPEHTAEKDAHGWGHPIRHAGGGVTYLPPLSGTRVTPPEGRNDA